MVEGGGPVVLEAEMAEPGEGIAGDRRADEPAPLPRRKERQDEQDRQAGAGIMQHPRPRIGMGAEIMRPEFGEAAHRLLLLRRNMLNDTRLPAPCQSPVGSVSEGPV